MRRSVEYALAAAASFGIGFSGGDVVRPARDAAHRAIGRTVDAASGYIRIGAASFSGR